MFTGKYKDPVSFFMREWAIEAINTSLKQNVLKNNQEKRMIPKDV